MTGEDCFKFLCDENYSLLDYFMEVDLRIILRDWHFSAFRDYVNLINYIEIIVVYHPPPSYHFVSEQISLYYLLLVYFDQLLNYISCTDSLNCIFCIMILV